MVWQRIVSTVLIQLVESKPIGFCLSLSRKRNQTMFVAAVELFTSLVFLASCIILVQPTHSAEYYKCVDGKGKIYFSNVACRSQAQKAESKQLRDTTESEYREAQREEEAAKKREKARQQADEQLEKARERAELLTKCLNEADERYQARWDDSVYSEAEQKDAS
jgi:hypothetical protein